MKLFQSHVINILSYQIFDHFFEVEPPREKSTRKPICLILKGIQESNPCPSVHRSGDLGLTTEGDSLQARPLTNFLCDSRPAYVGLGNVPWNICLENSTRWLTDNQLIPIQTFHGKMTWAFSTSCSQNRGLVNINDKQGLIQQPVMTLKRI